MIKLVVLLRRKPGLTHQQFKAHYESRHVALVQAAFSSIKRYTRNYVLPGESSTSVGWSKSERPDFDVITELWFEDKAAYDAFITDLSDPDKTASVQADEGRFIDRSSIRTFLVEELES